MFNIVGQEKGYVNGSNVTSSGGPDSNAFFQLSVPELQPRGDAGDLSQLKGAHVVSRTDNTNDITAQVGGAGQRLAEARALRRSLLKQLANATTTEQVTSIQARLHDANASIASDLSNAARSPAPGGLQQHHRPHPVQHGPAAGDSPPHRAGSRSARRRTTPAASWSSSRASALIVLAVLVPIGLVAALLAWVGFAVRRRRRDQALDLV